MRYQGDISSENEAKKNDRRRGLCLWAGTAAGLWIAILWQAVFGEWAVVGLACFYSLVLLILGAYVLGKESN